MTARLYKPEDYALLESWWSGHAVSAARPDMLSKTGVIIAAGAPICAGFLYSTDSSMAYIDAIVADPASSRIVRRAALELLVRSLKYVAHLKGYRHVVATAGRQSLIDLAEREGFVVHRLGLALLHADLGGA